MLVHPVPIAIAAIALARTAPAYACSCGSEATITAEGCANTRRVFAGTIHANRETYLADVLLRGKQPVEVELAVDRVWRGDVPGTVLAYTRDGCCDCGIWVKPGTRFVVCDNEADEAAPEFGSCAHPAFDAPALEAALGPALEPSRGFHLGRRVRQLVYIEWVLPIALATGVALVGRRKRRAGPPDPLPRAASNAIPRSLPDGRRLGPLAIVLGVVSIAALGLAMRFGAYASRNPIALAYGPIVLATVLGAGIGFEGQRRPSLFRGSSRAYLATLVSIAFVVVLGYVRLPWWSDYRW
jgi:hypothetical protein